MLIRWLTVLSSAIALWGQSQPPVILVDAAYPNCAAIRPGSTTAFGQLEQKLTASGYSTIFFSPCSVTAKDGLPFTPVEELGQALGALIERTGAPQVDLILYGMGALIGRCYFSGKQTEPGVFNPPANPKVRKAVFLAGPHFGGPPLAGASDRVSSGLVSGSRFVWDLATWNQGGDDLRGIDAIAVIGNGAGDSDGIVPLTSGSLSFALPAERTRVVRACMSSTICAPRVSYIDSETHPTWLIVKSFLAGTGDWKQAGVPADRDPLLSTKGGILVSVKDAFDMPVAAAQVSASGLLLGKSLSGDTGLFYSDFVSNGEYTLQASAPTGIPPVAWRPALGGFSIATAKPGPIIARAVPTAGLVDTLSLAAGSCISVYGTRLGKGMVAASALPLPAALGETTITVNGKPIGLYFAGESQLNAVLPDDLSGLVRMTVKTGDGAHSINLLIEDAVPAVFTLAQTGSGPAAALHAVEGGPVNDANPARIGEYVSVYLTGLGATEVSGGLQVAKLKPEAAVDGVPATVAWAGRAPGFAGLDQVNILIPAGVRAGNSVPLTIKSGKRVSNTTTLSIR